MEEKLNIERRTWDIVQFRINQYTISWPRHLNHPLHVTCRPADHPVTWTLSEEWTAAIFILFNIQLPNMIQQLQAKRFNRNVISYTIIFISLTHTVYLIYSIAFTEFVPTSGPQCGWVEEICMYNVCMLYCRLSGDTISSPPSWTGHTSINLIECSPSPSTLPLHWILNIVIQYFLQHAVVTFLFI